MTESHLRRLSVTMRGLEDALLDIEAALADPPNLIMTIYEDQVPHAVRAEIRERILQTREEIRVVRDRYGLDSQVVSNRRRISTKLVIQSIDLTEATSRYLRAYGEVPKDERRPLDDQIGKMISLVDGLNKLIQ
jgi:hypothetical protein